MMKLSSSYFKVLAITLLCYKAHCNENLTTIIGVDTCPYNIDVAGVFRYFSSETNILITGINIQNNSQDTIYSVHIGRDIKQKNKYIDEFEYKYLLPFPIPPGGEAGFSDIINFSRTNIDLSEPRELIMIYSIVRINNVFIQCETSPLYPTRSSWHGKISFVHPNNKKRVLIEATMGTWCGLCPRTIVDIENWIQRYPDGSIIPINVHTRHDPMTLEDYMEQITPFYLDKTPWYYVDRLTPFTGDDNIDKRKSEPAPAEIYYTREYNPGDRHLTINVKAEMLTDVSTGLRFAVIIKENDVTGSTRDYGQSNSYAGGALGPMGGFENKPPYIRQGDILHQHVARILVGGWAGVEVKKLTSHTRELGFGDKVEHRFVVNLPSWINERNIDIVAILIDESTGQIINANGEERISTSTFVGQNTNQLRFNVFPNPVEGNILNIHCANNSPSTYNVSLLTLMGNEIISQRITTTLKQEVLKIDVNDLLSGKPYLLQITDDRNSSYITTVIK